MKHILFFILILTTIGSYGQVPKSIKYQAVVRDFSGEIQADKLVSFRLSILADDPNGLNLYTETQQLATNPFGVANFNIGEGNIVSGDFEAIDWSEYTFFLKIELDLNGGSNYQFMGTSQLLSVPLAFYAEEAGRSLNDMDTSSTNEIQDLVLNGNNLEIENNPNPTTIDLSPYIDNTDNQTLNLSGNTLSISGGNSIQIPPDNDADPTNELQDISQNGLDVTLSNNGGTISIADNDNDSSNEIQSITKVGNQVTLSQNGGNFIDEINDADNNPANEIQNITKTGNTITLDQNGGSIIDSDNQQLSIVGNQLSISDGNSITLSGAVDLDPDPTNEIQSITKTGNIISLSDNGGDIVDSDNQDLSSSNSGTQRTVYISAGTETSFDVADNDNDETNELQVLDYSHDTLSLSDGNYVVLSLASLMPEGYCFNSLNSTPPDGFTYSGDNFLTEDHGWSTFPTSYIPGSSVKGLCELNGYIYIMREHSNNIPTLQYDPQTKSFSNKANFPYYTQNSYKFVSFQGKIYSFSSSYTHEYDPISDTWTQKMTVPNGGYIQFVISNSTFIYVYVANSSSSSFYKFDPTLNSWSTCANISPRQNVNIFVYNEDFYVVGGYLIGLGAGPTSQIYHYDTQQNLWTNKFGLVSPSYNSVCQMVEDKIYCIGGGSSPTYLDLTQEYDILNDTCVLKSSLPYSDAAMSSFVYNQSIYILDFESSGDNLRFVSYDTANDEYKILPTNSAPSFFPSMYIPYKIVGDKVFYYDYPDESIEYDLSKRQKTFYIHCK